MWITASTQAPDALWISLKSCRQTWASGFTCISAVIKAKVGHFSPTPRSCAPCWRRGDREKSWSLPAGLDSITLLILLPTSSPRDCAYVCERERDRYIERGEKDMQMMVICLQKADNTHIPCVKQTVGKTTHTQTHTHTLKTLPQKQFCMEMAHDANVEMQVINRIHGITGTCMIRKIPDTCIKWILSDSLISCVI